MTRFQTLTLGLTLPAALLSSAAYADLTPQDVWGDWRSYLEGMGYAVQATEAASGSDLTVSDISINFDMPDDGKMSIMLDQIAFNQNRDGTVEIVLPDRMPMTMTGVDSGPDARAMTMTLGYTHSGQAMTASGTPEQLTYLYTAQSMGVQLEEMLVEGQPVGADKARMSFTGTDLNTTTVLSKGDARDYQQTGSIGSVAYDIFFVDQENQNSEAAMKGSIAGITLSGNGSIPNDMPDSTDMSQMLAAGFAATGTFAYTQGSSKFDIKDPESGSFQMATSSAGGELGVEMGSGGLSYLVAQRDLNAGVTVEGMPFPFEVSMKESGFNLKMPVTPSDDPQDFALGITMGDFTMSDMIWSMFDPSAQLPRDPASILLDVNGTAKLLVDWMNPEAAAGAAMPAEVQTLTLGKLLVAAAGAQLQGSGAVEVVDAAPAIIPGVGNPVGTLNFDLSGGNALLDKLVAMGLLPQDQAMGARMMMGLFAVPGDGPDTLKSKIEMTPDGQILANGQRIR